MAIIDIITAAGEWAHGGNPEDVAGVWERAGFDEDEVEAWLQQGRCFDPWDAVRLRAAGVTPEQAAAKIERGGVAETIGYWYANNDLTLKQALGAIRIAGLSEPCYHCAAQEATRANGTLCENCADGTDAWDPTDDELLRRLGRAEVRAWRKAAWEQGDYATVDLLDDSGITGTSRWETLSQRAEREGVSAATIRRAIDRGLTSRKRGDALEVDRTEPLPPAAQRGPKHTYVVREPGGPAWWEGTTRAAAERELRRALAAGLGKARILRDGEWL